MKLDRVFFNYPTGFGKTRRAIRWAKAVRVDRRKLQTCVVVVPNELLKQQWITALSTMKYRKSLCFVVTSINKVDFKSLDCSLLILDEFHLYKTGKRLAILHSVVNDVHLCLLSATANAGTPSMMGIRNVLYERISIKQAVSKGRLSKYKLYEHLVTLTTEERALYDKCSEALDKAREYVSKWCAATNQATINVFEFLDIYAQSAPIDGSVWESMCVVLGGTSKWRCKQWFMDVYGKAQGRKQLLSCCDSKTHKVIEILSYIEGKTIVFCGNQKQAMYLSRLYADRNYCLVTSKYRESNMAVPFKQALLQADILFVVDMLKQGFDYPTLNNAIFTKYEWKSDANVQAIGRVLRWQPRKVANIHCVYVRDTIEVYKANQLLKLYK
jgi:superfamily II DNA or RNA helicase